MIAITFTGVTNRPLSNSRSFLENSARVMTDVLGSAARTRDATTAASAPGSICTRR